MIGLQPFVNQRAAYLNTVTELIASAPAIDSLEVSDASPDPADPVTVTAWVRPAGSAIASVELYYRASPAEVYQRMAMSAGGGDQYSAVLPIAAVAGQRVAYYAAATAANSHSSVSFYPARTEWDPQYVEYTFGATGGVRITEWMYSGASGEFVEFTNTSDAPVDMTGWSFDDDHATPGAFDLSAFGVVQPDESVVITESPAESFRSDWGLGPNVKIIGELGAVNGNNLARNDEINLYDAGDVLVDRLRYGDQTFAGTIRTQNASGQTCCQFIGQNDVYHWELSALGDLFGSFAAATGDVGNPGSFDWSACAGCGTTSVIASAPHHPTTAWLAPAQPNPFSASTEILFGLDHESMVSFAIYDATGRQVRRLADRTFTTGSHRVLWDGTDGAGHRAPAGIYIARLVAGDEVALRKFVRVR